MKYTVCFGVMGVYLALLAVSLGGIAWILLWPALSFVVLAIAYAGVGPSLLGKQPDGRIRWWSWLLNGPVFLLLWILWHLQRLLTREPTYHEICPNLRLGRRPLSGEVPAATQLLVDLTAEFPAVRTLPTDCVYLCIPTLDATAPSTQSVRLILERIAGCEGGIYLHCAAGKGRSAMIAVAVFISQGRATSINEAVKLVRAKRPGVRLNRVQVETLRQVFEEQQTHPIR